MVDGVSVYDWHPGAVCGKVKVMSPRGTVTGPADYVGLSVRNCPKCGGPLFRVRRSFLDRVISLFSTKHRYRCRGFSCQWEGRLAIDAK